MLLGFWSICPSVEVVLQFSPPQSLPSINQSNDVGLASILFPVLGNEDDGGYVTQNHLAMRKLFVCIESDSCSPNQMKGNIGLYPIELKNEEIDNVWCASRDPWI